MSEPTLVPSPLYGLRTWSVVGEPGEERLAGPQMQEPWPDGGEWLTATCASDPGHAAPASDCACGVHAWHPSLRTARRVLATRREVPGVVEARGAIELHREGFRAEQARPFALMVAPGRNAALVDRLAAAYDAEAVPVSGPDAIVDWCRSRSLGLEPEVVDELLGPERVSEQRRRVRVVWLRFAAGLAAIAVLLALGLAFTASPGDRRLFGRTGEVHQHPQR
jgi:hypothetical protein